MSEGPEWFAPKRYGYGTGIPISWTVDVQAPSVVSMNRTTGSPTLARVKNMKTKA